MIVSASVHAAVQDAWLLLFANHLVKEIFMYQGLELRKKQLQFYDNNYYSKF